jgi:nitric oxide reductase subunit C
VAEGDPVRGKALFSVYLCDSCHSVARPFPGGVLGPNLGNISEEALRIIALPEYEGTADDAASYIRESILEPNVYIVPSEFYINAPGVSVMEQDFREKLAPQELQDLIAYLLSLDAQ